MVTVKTKKANALTTTPGNWEMAFNWIEPVNSLRVTLYVGDGYKRTDGSNGRPSECDNCPPVPVTCYEYTVSAQRAEGSGPFYYNLPYRKPKPGDSEHLMQDLYIYSALDKGGNRKEKMKVTFIGTVVPLTYFIQKEII